jgi:type I restriction enzyme S subunit
LEEQIRVVTVLDEKIPRIDELIQRKRQRIRLIRDLSTSLIHETVTRGLDPGVQLRPSGDQWIGEHPEHWTTSRLKYHSNFINGCSFKPDEWKDSGIPIIRIQNLNGSETFNYVEPDPRLEKYLLRKGDLLFSWSGNVGTSFGPYRWDREGDHYLNQHIFRLELFDDVHPGWFYYVLKGVTQFIEDSKTTGIIGMVHVTKGELGSTKIPFPPMDEQETISKYLDEELLKIQEQVKIEEGLISRLEDLRPSLLYEVVTGKIDVRKERGHEVH